MALGGGVWVTQNEKLPGAYINFVSVARATSTIGARGYAAIVLDFTGKDNDKISTVVELTAADFANQPEAVLGEEPSAKAKFALTEMFKHASVVYVYEKASDDTVAEALAALETYEFNTIAAYTDVTEDIATYVSTVKSWRDDFGKKCVLVAYNNEADYEGVINVVSTVKTSDAIPAYAMVAWVTGAEAGCEVNESCTNKIYDGDAEILCTHTQSQLEESMENGEFVFHRVYGKIRVLDDINSLTTTTAEKSDDFKSNQTMRVCDQIANDIAKLFAEKYIGTIPNDDSGRASLWGDVVKHHKELETIRAIQGFNPELVSVVQGANKKSVVVTDYVTPINAMAQLYLTVVVQ